MPRDRADPVRQRFPALTGGLVVDAVNGKVRVRKWPKKRGKPTHPNTIAQNAWFKEANRQAKLAEGAQVVLAQNATKGTGLYPRDLLLKTMSSGLVDLVMPDGRVLTHYRPRVDAVTFQGVIQRPVANVPLPLGVATNISWGLPVRDTANFWNAGQPTRFTIPQGVTQVRVECGGAFATNVAGVMILVIRKNGVASFGASRQSASGRALTTVSTGATEVVAGDFFEMQASIFASNGLLGGGLTFFTLEVLGAV